MDIGGNRRRLEVDSKRSEQSHTAEQSQTIVVIVAFSEEGLREVFLQIYEPYFVKTKMTRIFCGSIRCFCFLIFMTVKL